MSLDKVFIDALEIQVIVGAHAHEQHAPRPLLLDLELGLDLRPAAASDQLRDTVDYQAIADSLAALGKDRRFQLVETFAESAARKLFDEFPIATLRLRIDKTGAVRNARGVGVQIERRREDYAACGR